MKRTPMPRRTEPMRHGITPMKRARLASVSAKRQRDNRVRRAMALAFFGPDPDCGCAERRARMLGLPPLECCTGRAEHLHEPLTRARGGAITDPGNAVPMCDPCNGWLSACPDSLLGWAYQCGLLVHSWGDPGSGGAA